MLRVLLDGLFERHKVTCSHYVRQILLHHSSTIQINGMQLLSPDTLSDDEMCNVLVLYQHNHRTWYIIRISLFSLKIMLQRKKKSLRFWGVNWTYLVRGKTLFKKEFEHDCGYNSYYWYRNVEALLYTTKDSQTNEMS